MARAETRGKKKAKRKKPGRPRRAPVKEPQDIFAAYGFSHWDLKNGKVNDDQLIAALKEKCRQFR